LLKGARTEDKIHEVLTILWCEGELPTEILGLILIFRPSKDGAKSRSLLREVLLNSRLACVPIQFLELWMLCEGVEIGERLIHGSLVLWREAGNVALNIGSGGGLLP